MSIKAVLFDLDGTLLPMDLDLFTNIYFGALTERVAKLGYDPRAVANAIMSGTLAMMKNDGKKLNSEVFWDVFTSHLGSKAKEIEAYLDEFYQSGYEITLKACSHNPEAARLISYLKGRGVRLILATNPLFPPIATERRMEWAGLDKSDFELYTTYDNSSYCKPNPEYYRAILAERGLLPEECLMVGNDITDDMVAEKLGMKVFLLTDCLINKCGADISVYAHGSFAELYEFLDTLT